MTSFGESPRLIESTGYHVRWTPVYGESVTGVGAACRRDADGVKEVSDSGGSELFGFLKGGDRRGARGGGHQQAGDFEALAGLEVGAEGDVEAGQVSLEAVDVPLHADRIEQQAGRGQIFDAVHGSPTSQDHASITAR